MASTLIQRLQDLKRRVDERTATLEGYSEVDFNFAAHCISQDGTNGVALNKARADHYRRVAADMRKRAASFNLPADEVEAAGRGYELAARIIDRLARQRAVKNAA